MDFPDLFSNGKSGGPGPRRVDRAAWLGSTVHRGSVDKRVWWHLAGAQHAGTRALPVEVEEDEPDEAVPEGCSPDHCQR
jgi:hypothetical protein